MALNARRLPCENYDISLHGHEITLSVVRNMESDQVHEVVFVGRGKIGQGIDLLLFDLGIALSRAIQRRDPQTGEPLE